MRSPEKGVNKPITRRGFLVGTAGAVGVTAAVAAIFRRQIGSVISNATEGLREPDDPFFGKAIDKDGKLVDPNSKEAFAVFETQPIATTVPEESYQPILRERPKLNSHKIGELELNQVSRFRRVVGDPYPTPYDGLRVFPFDPKTGQRSEDPRGVWYQSAEPLVVKGKGMRSGFTSGNGLSTPPEKKLEAFLAKERTQKS